MTILNYLPPMRTDEGDLLIDGGYINNCPVDVMQDLYSPHILIAIDVERKDLDTFQNITNYGSYLNGFWLMARRMWSFIWPFATPLKIPTFPEIISSLNYINHNRHIQGCIENRLMDIYVRPELGQIQLLDYQKMPEIVQAGYRAAKISLARFKIENPERVFGVQRQQGMKRSASLSDLYDPSSVGAASLPTPSSSAAPSPRLHAMNASSNNLSGMIRSRKNSRFQLFANSQASSNEIAALSSSAFAFQNVATSSSGLPYLSLDDSVASTSSPLKM